MQTLIYVDKKHGAMGRGVRGGYKYNTHPSNPPCPSHLPCICLYPELKAQQLFSFPEVHTHRVPRFSWRFRPRKVRRFLYMKGSWSQEILKVQVGGFDSFLSGHVIRRIKDGPMSQRDILLYSMYCIFVSGTLQ